MVPLTVFTTIGSLASSNQSMDSKSRQGRTSRHHGDTVLLEQRRMYDAGQREPCAGYGEVDVATVEVRAEVVAPQQDHRHACNPLELD